MTGAERLTFNVVTPRSLAVSTAARDDGELFDIYPRPVLLVPIDGEWCEPERSRIANTDTEPGEPYPGGSRFEAFHDAVITRLVPTPGSGRRHVTIGRSASDDVFVPLLSVSRCHGCILVERGAVYRDCVSTNGSWVQDRFVKPNEAVELEDGDVISLGPDLQVLYLEPEGLRALLRHL